MRDFEDTVPVDMAGFLSIQCDNCGELSDPGAVAVTQADGLAWVCPHCGGHNFEDGPMDDAGGGLADDQQAFLDELDELGGVDDLGVEDDDDLLVECQQCGHRATIGEMGDPGHLTYINFICPECGAADVDWG